MQVGYGLSLLFSFFIIFVEFFFLLLTSSIIMLLLMNVSVISHCQWIRVCLNNRTELVASSGDIRIGSQFWLFIER